MKASHTYDHAISNLLGNRHAISNLLGNRHAISNPMRSGCGGQKKFGAQEKGAL